MLVGIVSGVIATIIAAPILFLIPRAFRFLVD
jgi:hypothetical protein